MRPAYLFADISHYSGWNPRLDLIAAMPQMTGLILKATEGQSDDGGWFAQVWPSAAAVGGARYGSTWFRGCYHFLHVKQDGAAQADFFLDAVERAGGWGPGDILPIVDVELEGANVGATATQVTSSTTAFAARIKQRTGKDTILYGRNALSELNITSRLGCAWVWDPSYTATPFTNGIEQFLPDRMVLWQYAGDGEGNASQHGLPLTVPGFGPSIDMSIYVDPKGASISSIKRRLLGKRSLWSYVGVGAAVALGTGIWIVGVGLVSMGVMDARLIVHAPEPEAAHREAARQRRREPGRRQRRRAPQS